MEIAKHFPGQFNCRFVTAMNQSSATTGVLKTALSVHDLYGANLTNVTSGQIPLGGTGPRGDYDYMVIMWCPVLSAIYSKGGGNSLGSGAKLSGLYMFQFNTGLEEGHIDFDKFDDARYAYSQTSIYGSDGSDIYNNAMTWASQISIMLTDPTSELSGVAKYGFFPVGSMFDDGAPVEWTIGDLQRSVFSTESLKVTKGRVSLQNAIVNHNVASKMGLTFGDISADNAFASEFVSFCILERPFVSLGEGVNVAYTMEAQVSSNYVANPRVDNAFARSIHSESGQINGYNAHVDNSPTTVQAYTPDNIDGYGDMLQIGKAALSFLPSLGTQLYR